MLEENGGLESALELGNRIERKGCQKESDGVEERSGIRLGLPMLPMKRRSDPGHVLFEGVDPAIGAADREGHPHTHPGGME